MAAPLGSQIGPSPRLWDPVVRISHWAIVTVVLLNAVLTKGGSTLHVWAGWIGMSILALRLVWGIIGPREARFSAFPPHPLAALRHLGDLVRGRPREYRSHNPAGALMAYALWALVGVATVTGLVMTDGATPMQIAQERAAVAEGDWSVLVKDGESGEDRDGDDRNEIAEEVHEVAANLILLLAFLHVAGVLVESRATRRNLVAPMLLGAADRNRR